MNLRDGGLIALGFLAGMLSMSVAMVSMARDVAETDKFMRALRIKFSDPTVRGQG